MTQKIDEYGLYHWATPAWLSIHKSWSMREPYIRQGQNPTGKTIHRKTKKSIVRVVETGEIREFESRTKMCEFLKINLNSLSKFRRKSQAGIITIRKKKYEVLQ